MAVKKPIPSAPVVNPLHNYASYTYTWSLWWLDVGDYNSLTRSTVESAVNYQLGPNSYVVAEDAGLYPDRRLPSTYGLNYYIQDVEFSTVIGLNKKSKSTNMIEGSFTIIEPYGVTLVDALLEASNTVGGYKNYLQQPYMLELNFTGYDDNGNDISSKYASIFRKRFPIKIIECKFSVGNKGTEYKLKFIPTGSGDAQSEEMRTLPLNVSITAKTVNEFFNGNPEAKPEPTKGLVQKLEEFYATEVLEAKREVADKFVFQFDTDIGKSLITSDKQTSLAQSNPKTKDLDLKGNNFNIPKGTTYVDIISKVLAQSDWLINEQLGIEKPDKKSGDQTSVFNAFKILNSSEFLNFDNTRNTYGKTINYKIHQYPTWKSDHPDLPQLADSTPFTSKKYDYMYTGKNIDIIDLKLQFDTTYYTAVNKYTKDKAATQTTKETSKNTIESKLPSFSAGLSFLAKFIPQLGQVPSITPIRYHNVVGDQSNTIGLNIINRPGAQRASDVMKSLYSNASGDMVNVQLTIVGDPTLIKQDDWLYAPDPKGGSSGATSASDSIGGLSLGSIGNQISGMVTTAVTNYATNLITSGINKLLGGLGLGGAGGGGGAGSYNALSQDRFAEQYGHIKMDTGEVVCSLTVNTPIDIDADITNQGLVYPQPGTRQSFFSGQYKVLTVKNKFAGGVFTQTLDMIRYNNSDAAKKFGGAGGSGGVGAGSSSDRENDAVSTNQGNQQETVPTNGSTPAGDQTYGDAGMPAPGVVTYDDGSSIQTFDDGSTLVTDTEGHISATDATDSGVVARSDNVNFNYNRD